MKKNLFISAAAILMLCATSVFTSCGDESTTTSRVITPTTTTTVYTGTLEFTMQDPDNILSSADLHTVDSVLAARCNCSFYEDSESEFYTKLAKSTATLTVIMANLSSDELYPALTTSNDYILMKTINKNQETTTKKYYFNTSKNSSDSDK